MHDHKQRSQPVETPANTIKLDLFQLLYKTPTSEIVFFS